MKKLILAVICALMLAVPVCAGAERYYDEGIDIEDQSMQFQGGINIYLENGAFAAGDVAGSADIVMIQASGQFQRNDIDAEVATYEHTSRNIQDQDNYYSKGYDYYYENYYRDGAMASKITAGGQIQEWTSISQLDTGYGVLQMYQHGFQKSSGITIETSAFDIGTFDYRD